MLDADIDALFLLPPSEFTAARNALAGRVGGADTKRIKALKKPTLAAWAVNQVVLRQAATFAEFRAAHRAALEATRGADAATIREAVVARRRALDAVHSLAEVALEEAGLGTSGATLDKARATLEALAADATLPAGRLAKELPRPGFSAMQPAHGGPLPLASSATTAIERARQEHRARSEAAEVAIKRAGRDQAAAERAAAEVARLEHRLEQARARAAEAREVAERSAAAAARATEAATAAVARLSRLDAD